MSKELAEYYKKQADKYYAEILLYAQFMGGLDAILTNDNDTPSERIKRAIEHMRNFDKKA